MSNDETPTPKTSGSYLFFRDLARELAKRCREASEYTLQQASIAEKVLAKLDIGKSRAYHHRSAELIDFAIRLESFVEDIDRWPLLTPEEVSQIRPKQISSLADLQKLVEQLLIKINKEKSLK